MKNSCIKYVNKIRKLKTILFNFSEQNCLLEEINQDEKYVGHSHCIDISSKDIEKTV